MLIPNRLAISVAFALFKRIPMHDGERVHGLFIQNSSRKSRYTNGSENNHWLLNTGLR